MRTEGITAAMETIQISEDADATADWLDQLLNAQAAEAAGQPFALDYVALEASDNGTRLGGLTAKFGREWVFLELLAVEVHARGKKIGSKLMAQLETIATERGKTGIWLDTYSFQAPGFYEKLGYTEIGRIHDYPHGHDRRFLAKRMDGQPVMGPIKI